MDTEERIVQLTALDADVNACTRCELHANRFMAPPTFAGRGSIHPIIVFIGEGPGAEEQRQGKPFVGPAGVLLEDWLVHLGLQPKDYYICNVVKCVDGNTLVRTPDGVMRIDAMVKQKYGGMVLSVLDGVLVQRHVVGWYRSRWDARRPVRLSYIGAHNNSKGRASVVLTEDHPVLTKRGWIPAGDVKPLEEINTGTWAPGRFAERILSGSMLGDATVSRVAPALTLAHSENQEEWLRLKASLAGAGTFSRTMNHCGKDGCDGHRALRFRSFSLPYWRHLRSVFYEGRRKHVPENWEMDAVSLASWYLDDGNLHNGSASIAISGFQSGERMRLLRMLRREGYDVRFWKRGYEVGFTRDATRKLCGDISTYVPPSMRYKVLDSSIPFDVSKYGEDSATFWAPALLDYPSEPPAMGHYKSAWDQPLYCIDVEEAHNFVTTAGVVHNCRPVTAGRNVPPTEPQMHACAPFLFRQLKVLAPGLIVALGKVPDAHLNALNIRHYQVPHPAYFLRRARLDWRPFLETLKRRLDYLRASQGGWFQ